MNWIKFTYAFIAGMIAVQVWFGMVRQPGIGKGIRFLIGFTVGAMWPICLSLAIIMMLYKRIAENKEKNNETEN